MQKLPLDKLPEKKISLFQSKDKDHQALETSFGFFF